MIVSVICPKGGTGKTTLAAHMSVWAKGARRHRGRDVVLIDLDPQGSLRDWHERRRQNKRLQNGIRVEDLGQLEVEKKLAARLRELNQPKEDGSPAPLIIVDTPPNKTHLLTAAMLADVIVIPVRTSILDLGPAVDVAAACQQKHPVIILNATRLGDPDVGDTRTFLQAEASEAIVAKSAVLERVAVRRTMAIGATVFDSFAREAKLVRQSMAAAFDQALSTQGAA